MSKTKDAIDAFMEVGAKHEVVLVGLADEVKRQQSEIRAMEHMARSAANSAAQSSLASLKSAAQVESAKAEISGALIAMQKIIEQVNESRRSMSLLCETIESRFLLLEQANQHQQVELTKLKQKTKRYALTVGLFALAGLVLSATSLAR